MKKSQRARLALLAAKDASALTPEERAELTQLQGIAATNLDASQDIDDTVAAAPAPTLFAALQGALSGFRDKARLGADLTTAQARITALEQERDAARAEVATLGGRLAEQAAQLAAVCGFLGLAVSDVAAKKPEEIQALLAQKISAAAVEQLAGAGVPASALPPKTEAAAQTAAELRAEFARITDSGARAAFYTQHRDAMYGAGAN